MKLRMVNCKLRVTRNRIAPRSGAVSPFVIRHSSFSGHSSFSPAFTLIELLLVLSLLVVITSLTAPAMATFIRSRALDSETRRLMALMHAAQSRAAKARRVLARFGRRPRALQLVVVHYYGPAILESFHDVHFQSKSFSR